MKILKNMYVSGYGQIINYLNLWKEYKLKAVILQFICSSYKNILNPSSVPSILPVTRDWDKMPPLQGEHRIVKK